MDDLMTKASGQFWVLIGSGIGMVLTAVLLSVVGAAREWLLKAIPAMLGKVHKKYPDKKDAEQNHRVYNELVELRVLTNADRSYVLRFHNGSEFLPNNPVWKISCTHEMVKSGVTYESSQMQNVLVSRVHNLASAVITGESSYAGIEVKDCSGCPYQRKCDKDSKHVVVVDVGGMEGSYGKFVLESRNIKTTVKVGMVNSGRVFGIVGLDFCERKLDGEELNEAVSTACKIAEKIQFHLLFKDSSPIVAE